MVKTDRVQRPVLTGFQNMFLGLVEITPAFSGSLTVTRSWELPLRTLVRTELAWMKFLAGRDACLSIPEQRNNSESDHWTNKTLRLVVSPIEELDLIPLFRHASGGWLQRACTLQNGLLDCRECACACGPHQAHWGSHLASSRLAASPCSPPRHLSSPDSRF